MSEYQPDYSHIEGRLTSASYLWWRANNDAKLEDYLTVFEDLKEISEYDFEGNNLLELEENIKNWKKEIYEWHGDAFDEILIEKVSFHQGCGDYNHEWHLVGKRKETDDERNVRIKKYKKEQKIQKIKETNEKKKKENKECLKLKKKFEPKSQIERNLELNKKLKDLGVQSEFIKKGDKNEK